MRGAGCNGRAGGWEDVMRFDPFLKNQSPLSCVGLSCQQQIDAGCCCFPSSLLLINALILLLPTNKTQANAHRSQGHTIKPGRTHTR